VLTNLLENAAKYSPDGSPIRVTADIEPGSDEISELRITVADQGAGIPHGEQERVFDKFYRLRGANRRAAGTGMGLAIVRGFVLAHGGRVWVESEPNHGSTFVVALPLAHEAPSQSQQEPLTPHPLEGIRP